MRQFICEVGDRRPALYGKIMCWGPHDRIWERIQWRGGEGYYHSTAFLLNTADAIAVLQILSKCKPLIYNMYSHANIKS
jgi:hypothetical protein